MLSQSELNGATSLGRGDTNPDSFNGRTGIWEDLSYYIDRRPFLGYGYAGFWTPAHINEISAEEKWGILDSHSAYLDYLLTLGAVGLAVICSCSLLVSGVPSFSTSSRGTRPWLFWVRFWCFAHWMDYSSPPLFIQRSLCSSL